MRSISETMINDVRIKTRSADDPMTSLSGGNQQKVSIAAAIETQPTVLVLEEPTRGVDLGSRQEIYRVLREYAAADHGVLMYCTEVPEVFEAADRVYVVAGKRVSAPLPLRQFPDVRALASAITRLQERGGEAAITAGATE
jgi:ABC-type sugar transport system ATPase subunit